MKISDFIIQSKSLAGFQDRTGRNMQQAVLETTDVWSNAACTGYCYAALKQAGVGMDEIGNILMALSDCYDRYTVAEAENFGFEQ